MITNTSTWKGPSQTKYTDELFKKLRQQYGSKLPRRDMFEGK